MKGLVLLTIVITSMFGGHSVLRAQKPLPAVHLTVTIEGTTSDQVTPTQVRSDSQGTYIDGVDGVTAEIGSQGNLNIQFWPSVERLYATCGSITPLYRDSLTRDQFNFSRQDKYLRLDSARIRTWVHNHRIPRWLSVMCRFKAWTALRRGSQRCDKSVDS
jgi:hypothetical protein